MKTEIREVVESDLLGLARLYDESVKGLAKELYSEDQVKAWSQFSEKKEDFARFIFKAETFVLVVDGELAAFCGYEKDGHIASLYSSLRWKGFGFGKKVLVYAMDVAKQKGIEDFYCEASFLSKSLFVSVGFEVVEMEQALYDGVSFDRFKMEKRSKSN